MMCPTCSVPLSIADRQGVEIDFCPKCRGVWLERGELDKIIERVTAAAGPGPGPAAGPVAGPVSGPAHQPPPMHAQPGHQMPYRHDDDDDDDDWKKRGYPPQQAPGYPQGYPAGQPYPPQYQQPYPPKKSKMKSLLGDLFDF